VKIRHGFVSNSSSNSFTCDISGRTKSGWDFSLDDADMYICEKGHVMCGHYVRDFITDLVAKGDVDAVIQSIEGLRIVPTSMCPICQLKYISEENILRYLCARRGQTYDEVRQAIGDDYGDAPEEFYEFIDIVEKRP